MLIRCSRQPFAFGSEVRALAGQALGRYRQMVELAQMTPGTPVHLQVRRRGTTRSFLVTLGVTPPKPVTEPDMAVGGSSEP